MTFLAALCVHVNAGPGDPDLSFNAGSILDFPPLCILRQSDGKVLIGGSFSTVPGLLRNNIARLTHDGDGDPTFVLGIGANGAIWAMALQADGRILLGGDFSQINGTNRNRLARLNPDGTLDPTFDAGSGADGLVRGFALQSDGKLVVCGYFTQVNGLPRNGIARLNADGSLDTGFNSGAGSTYFASCVLLQPDGKIILGGYFSYFNGVASPALVRLDGTGAIDPSFHSPFPGGSYVEALALQPDGKLLAGGSSLARMNVDGSPDQSFHVSTSGINAIGVQSDGKIVLGGQFNAVNGEGVSYLARLHPGGSIDTSFVGGSQAFPGVLRVVVEPEDTILVSAYFDAVGELGGRRLIRLNANGSLNNDFEASRGIDGLVYDIKVQSDNKVLIAGFFKDLNGVPRADIARLDAAGHFDKTFDPGTILNTAFFSQSNSVIYSMALQPDGKIVVAGGFTNISGIGRNNIARLNADGTVDLSFNPGSGANYSVYRVLLQDDGKLLISGGFDEFSGISRGSIARLLPDGSLDQAFSPQINFPEEIALQPDGRILVGGYFTQVNGVVRTNLARLNPDGTLDTSFPSLALNNGVDSICILKSGKILITGFFDLVNGVSRKRVARLNSEGNLDMSFDLASRLDGSLAFSLVTIYAEQPNGKVLLWGDFTHVDGVLSPGLARLNADDTLDRQFNTPSGLTSSITCAAIQPDGRILLGGDFSQVGNLPRRAVARLLGDPVGPVILIQPATQTNFVGRATTFTVSASGEGPLTYQWFFNGRALSEGPHMSGVTSDTLTIRPNRFSDSGQYTVAVSNLAGSVTSERALLTVVTPGQHR